MIVNHVKKPATVERLTNQLEGIVIVKVFIKIKSTWIGESLQEEAKEKLT